MSEEKKTVELNDEELERISGGDGLGQVQEKWKEGSDCSKIVINRNDSCHWEQSHFSGLMLMFGGQKCGDCDYFKDRNQSWDNSFCVYGKELWRILF